MVIYSGKNIHLFASEILGSNVYDKLTKYIDNWCRKCFISYSDSYDSDPV